MKQCASCAARPEEAEFPPAGRLCCACLDERPGTKVASKPTSRRSYRAKLRARHQSPQMDLIDLITPVPGGPL